jgi:hypothetical protein
MPVGNRGEGGERARLFGTYDDEGDGWGNGGQG